MLRIDFSRCSSGKDAAVAGTIVEKVPHSAVTAGSDLLVHVAAGEVHISGTVPSAFFRSEVADMVREASNGSSVISSIRIDTRDFVADVP